MKKYIWGFIILSVFCVSVYNFYLAYQNVKTKNLGENVEAMEGVTEGKMMPLFDLLNFDGNKVVLDGQHDKKIYVLNFWASWCPPCRAEMPDMETFYKNEKDKVSFFAIDLEENKEKVGSFIEKNQYDFPVLLDSDGTIGRTFKIRDIPTTLIVDTTGKIRYRKTGMTSKNELEEELKLILNEG